MIYSKRNEVMEVLSESEVEKKGSIMAKKITVDIDVNNLDEYVNKANELVELLKKAKSLADELALVDFNINL